MLKLPGFQAGIPRIFATALAPLVNGKIHHIIDHTKLGDSISDIWRVKKVLPKPSYDVIINTDQHILPNFILKNVPHTRYISASMKWFMSDQRPPLSPDQSHYKKPILLLDRLMDLLSAATGRKIAPLFNIDIPQEIIDLARSYLPIGKNVLLAPGAGGD